VACWPWSISGGALTLRDVQTWQELAGLPPGRRHFVAFAPNGKRLATNHGGQVQLRDARTLAVTTTRGDPWGGAVRCGCFSRDGTNVAVGTEDRAVRLWDLAAGQVRELRGHREQVSCVAFSPDGRTLASAGWDRTVRLWSVAAGQEAATLEAHGGKVHALAFSPDGRLLASGGENWQGVGEVLFWNAERELSRPQP
jgi:WD40 repeat protein